MQRRSPFTLTILILLHFLIMAAGISTAQSIIAYNSLKHAVAEERTRSFRHMQSVADIIIENKQAHIEAILTAISTNPLLIKSVQDLDQENAYRILSGYLDTEHAVDLDVAFLSIPEEPVWVDVSGTMIDIGADLPKLVTGADAHLQPWALNRISHPENSATMLTHAVSIIAPYSGRVIGHLYGGIILEDSIHMLETILDTISAEHVIIFWKNQPIASAGRIHLNLLDHLQEVKLASEAHGFAHLDNKLVTLAPLQKGEFSQSLTMLLAVDDSSVQGIIDRQITSGLFSLAVVLVTCLLGTLSLTHILRPRLQALVAYAKDVASGREDSRYDGGLVKEFHSVGHSLEAMVKAMSEQRKQLQSSDARFRLITETTGLLVYDYDIRTGKITWGGAITELTGYTPSEFLNVDVEQWAEMLHPDDRAKVLANLDIATAKAKPFTDQYRLQKKDGNYVHVEDTGSFLTDEEGKAYRMLGVFSDVSERLRMQQLLIQSEKMMSIGGLAAGMAHEINNPLGAILQGAQNMERRVSPDFKANQTTASELGTDMETIHGYMEKRGLFRMLVGIREAGERAATIVTNMLDFSRKKPGDESSTCQLNDVITNTVKLVSTDYDMKKKYDFRKIEVVTNYADGVPIVTCKSSELEQVVMNLLTNAAQAIHDWEERTEEPRITITTRHTDSAVVISVADNGPGIPEEIRSRIFEPFYTTKPPGEGTGLGLSVSYFIVANNHGGRLSVQSEPGKGTTFTITLPIPTTEDTPQ